MELLLLLLFSIISPWSKQGVNIPEYAWIRDDRQGSEYVS